MCDHKASNVLLALLSNDEASAIYLIHRMSDMELKQLESHVWKMYQLMDRESEERTEKKLLAQHSAIPTPGLA